VTSYTTQYQVALLKYVENEYVAKHRRLSIIKPKRIPSNNLFPSTMASRSGQSSFDPYDLSSDDEEYLMPEQMAEMTPICSDRPAPSLTATRLYLNSPAKLPQNWGQVDPDLNNYHSDPMEIFDTWYHQIVGSTRGNTLNVCGSLQCGMQHILYHTTWCQGGVQIVLGARHYRLEAVKNNWWDPVQESRRKVVCSSQSRDISRQSLSIQYDGNWNLHRNEQSGGGKRIPQNGQCP